MNDLYIFLDAKIENTGVLSGFADGCLEPVRYFFRGRNVSIRPIDGNGEVHHIKSFKMESSIYCRRFHSKTDPELKGKKVTFLRAVKMSMLFVPGFFIGTIAKALSYLSKDIRENHRLVKEHFRPIDLMKIQLGQDLSKMNYLNQKIQNLVLEGDGKTLIEGDPGLKRFYPQKRLILDGVDYERLGCSSMTNDDGKKIFYQYSKDVLKRTLSDETIDRLFEKYKGNSHLRDSLFSPDEVIVVENPFCQKLYNKRFTKEIETSKSAEEALKMPIQGKKAVIQVAPPSIKEHLTKKAYNDLLTLFGSQEKLRLIKKFDGTVKHYRETDFPFPMNFNILEEDEGTLIQLFIKLINCNPNNTFQNPLLIMEFKEHTGWKIIQHFSDINLKTKFFDLKSNIVDNKGLVTDKGKKIQQLLQDNGVIDNSDESWILGTDVNRLIYERNKYIFFIQRDQAELDEYLKEINEKPDISGIDLKELMRDVKEKKSERPDSPVPKIKSDIVRALKTLQDQNADWKEIDLNQLHNKEYTNYFSDPITRKLIRIKDILERWKSLPGRFETRIEELKAAIEDHKQKLKDLE